MTLARLVWPLVDFFSGYCDERLRRSFLGDGEAIFHGRLLVRSFEDDNDVVLAEGEVCLVELYAPLFCFGPLLVDPVCLGFAAWIPQFDESDEPHVRAALAAVRI
jgi:hypothetical protein